MAIDDLFRALQEALESGMEVTITLKKPPVDKAPGNPAPNSVTCTECGWRHSYSRHDNAVRGLRAHSKSCKGKVKRSEFTHPKWLEDQAKGK